MVPRSVCIAPLLAAVFTFAPEARAKDFRVHRDWAFTRTAAELVRIATSYADGCDHGCVYRAPTVERAVVLAYGRKPDDFYVWTSTDDIQDSEWFSHVTITRSGHHTRLDFRMVGEKLAETLEKASGKESDPATDFCTVTYDIDEEFDGERFLRSRVSFAATVQLSGFVAWIGGGIVRSRLADAAHAVFLNLKEGKIPPVRD